MPQLLRPPRPLPAPLEPSPPLDPASMPSPPPPAPPVVAAAEDADLLPPMTRIKLLFPKAVKGVFGGMNRAWGVAFVGFHAFICVVKIVSFTTDPEVARFWVPIFRVWLYLGVAAILLMLWARIFCWLYGVDDVKDSLPKQLAAAAAAALQLPPPPPEMDTC